MRILKRSIPAIVFMTAFIAYLLTVCPTVYVGDSGEMIAAAYTMGIAHPPGYPLYCMTGKIMSYIPAGTIALRVNLTAAVFSALAVSALYLFLSSFAGSLTLSLAAAFAALAFGFSSTFWSQALMTKGGLYGLNAFITALLLLMLLKIKKEAGSNRLKNLRLLAIISGFGLANHNTIAPLIPFVILYALYLVTFDFKDRIKRAFWFSIYGIYCGALALVFALLIYMYLPLRSAANPPIDWGHPANFYNFLNHVLRKQYSLGFEARSFSVFLGQLGTYFKFMTTQFSTFIIWLILPGAWYCYKKAGRGIFLILLITFLLTSLGLVLMSNFKWTAMDLYVNEVFFIPSYLVCAVWLFFGILFFFDLARGGKAGVLITAVSASCMLLPLAQNFRVIDRSRNTIAYDFGVNILKTPEKGAVLFLSGDNPTFIPAYLQMVEKAREDLEIFDDYGRVFRNIYGDDFLRMATGVYQKRLNEVQRQIINTSGRVIYCYPGSNIDNMDDLKMHYEGILKKIGGRPSGKRFEYSLKGINDKTIHMDYFCRELIGQYYMTNGDQFAALGSPKDAMQEYLTAMETAYDNPMIQNSIGQAVSRISPEKAIPFYQNVIKNGSVSSDLYNNLGTAYYGAGKLDESIAEYRKAIELDGKYFKSYFNLGVTYLAKKKMKDAEDCFTKCVELNPTYTDAYYALGNTYFTTGNFRQALDYYAKTVALNPNFAYGWNAVGASLYSLGRFEDAASAYKTAVRLDPNYRDAVSNLLMVIRQLNANKSGVEFLEGLLRENPGNENLKSALRSLR